MTLAVSPLPLLMTVTEVSETTGLSKSFVYELVAGGVLPSIRIRRAVRIPSDRLVRWIEDQIEDQG